MFFAENDKDYVGLLVKDEDKYTLTVTSPDSLNGLKVMYENGEYSAAFSGGKMPFSPKKDFFMQEIIEFIESSSADSETLCEEKDGKYIIHQNRWELRFSKN